jgi:hypothetical protein
LSLIYAISESSWVWLGAIIVLGVGGFLFFDKLMRKGIDEESTKGRSRTSSAFSELQSMIDPAHRHVMEERDRKRNEHDDAGDDPDQHEQN